METIIEQNFENLCQIEPQLKILEGKTRKLWLFHYPNWTVEYIWYHELKPEMIKLVGFGASNSRLRTSEAYDCCYKALFSLLTTGRTQK